MKNIKIAFDPKTNLYMASAQDFRGYSTSKILVDGKEVQNPMNSPYIIFRELPKTITYQSTGKRHVGFINQEGKTITDDEYSELNRSISKNASYDDDREELTFKSVEDEVAYVRFRREWIRHYTEETTEEPINIEVIHHPVSDTPEIMPMYLERGTIFDTMCIYNCNAAELFIKRCEERGLTKGKHENEKGFTYWLNHKDNYRFGKLGGSYCTSDVESSQFKSHRKGSYEELKTVHEENIKRIDTIIDRFIAKQNEEALSAETLGGVITTMYGIKSRLSGIEANAKTRSSYNLLCNFLQEEIAKLEKISIKK
jgi:hypothetical protein